jgi:hypothetical protein
MAERFAGFGGISENDPAITIDGTGEITNEPGVASGEAGSDASEDRLIIHDPGAGSAPGGTTGPKPKRKYTKRAGSKNKTISEAIVGLEEILVTLHHTIAEATKCPEFNLDTDEAQAIGKAVHNVAAEYDYQDLPKTTRQTFVWGNLIIMLMAFYGARIFDIAQRKRQELRGVARMPPIHSTVVDIETMRNRPDGS